MMDLQEAVSDYSGDILFYYGAINRMGYHRLSAILESIVDKQDRLCLILVTYGGDPSAADRMARALRHYYRNIDILIPDICKSAGTLMCIGSNKLIIGDRGELGPLDIQLSKPDELFENMSGLDIIQAIELLKQQTLTSFEGYLINIRKDIGIKTKTASDIAMGLTASLINPMASKIDPITLGEHQRAMQIAKEYGERLNSDSKSLKSGALLKLIGDYPSHGFIIDRKEARDLFEHVIAPDDETNKLYVWSRDFVDTTTMPDDPIIADLVKESATQNNQEDNNNEETNITTDEIQERETADRTTNQEGGGNEQIDNE